MSFLIEYILKCCINYIRLYILKYNILKIYRNFAIEFIISKTYIRFISSLDYLLFISIDNAFYFIIMFIALTGNVLNSLMSIKLI